jgi:hypothetical protein
MNAVGKYYLGLLLLLSNASLFAGDVVSSFLEKHGKDENLEVISIGKAMIEKMCKISGENPELKITLENLENIRVVYSVDTLLNTEYFESALQICGENEEYEELDICSLDTLPNMSILVRKNRNRNSVRELLLVSNDDTGFNMISMQGRINLENLLAYSDKIGINGLKNIQLKNGKNN